MGLAVALLCGLGVPVAYATIEYFERADFLSFKAQINAGRLARFITSQEAHWQDDRAHLSALIELPPDNQQPLRQRVVDDGGNVLAEEGPAPAGPVLRRSAPIIVKGVTVGRIEAEVSLSA